MLCEVEMPQGKGSPRRESQKPPYVRAATSGSSNESFFDEPAAETEFSRRKAKPRWPKNRDGQRVRPQS